MELSLPRLSRRPGNEESSRQTKERLQKALLALLSQGVDIHAVTITGLTRLAGVSRQAFYRNYKSMQELLLTMGKELAQKVDASIPRIGEEGITWGWYCQLFQALAGEAQPIRALLATLKDPRHGARVAFSLQNYTDQALDRTDYRLLAFNSAMSAVIDQWILGGLKESAEEMAALCIRIFGALGQNWSNLG